MSESTFFDRTFGALLFDMDGTIINSIAAAERVWTAWAERHGLDVGSFLPTIHGVRAIETITKLELPGVDPQAEVHALLLAEIEDVEGVEAIEGAKAFLASLPPDRRASPRNYTGVMPPKGGADLSDQDVAAVAAYVWAVGHANYGPCLLRRLGRRHRYDRYGNPRAHRNTSGVSRRGEARDGEPAARDTQSGRDPHCVTHGSRGPQPKRDRVDPFASARLGGTPKRRPSVLPSPACNTSDLRDSSRRSEMGRAA